MKRVCLLYVLPALVGSIVLAARVDAQPSTAFTYQGLLETSGTKLSGDADLKFRLYDALQSGQQVGTENVRAGVVVSAGVFTTGLDFGALAFGQGQDRWLEIEVRSPAGSGAFTVLSPRTIIRPVPMAVAAQSASTVPWGGVNDVPANVSNAFSPWVASPPFGINLQSANVGIRTTVSPLNALTVNGVGSFTGGVAVGTIVASPYQLAVTGGSWLRGAVTIGDGSQTQFPLAVFGDAAKTGGGSWSSLSDSRLKHDITPMQGTLDRLLSLRGYTFEYNADVIEKGIARPGQQIGLLAQEVERVFPDWVGRDADGYRFVTERATTALMVEALRDLRAEKDREIRVLQNEAVTREVDAATKQREIDELKARLDRLEAKLK